MSVSPKIMQFECHGNSTKESSATAQNDLLGILCFITVNRESFMHNVHLDLSYSPTVEVLFFFFCILFIYLFYFTGIRQEHTDQYVETLQNLQQIP